MLLMTSNLVHKEAQLVLIEKLFQPRIIALKFCRLDEHLRGQTQRIFASSFTWKICSCGIEYSSVETSTVIETIVTIEPVVKKNKMLPSCSLNEKISHAFSYHSCQGQRGKDSSNHSRNRVQI